MNNTFNFLYLYVYVWVHVGVRKKANFENFFYTSLSIKGKINFGMISIICDITWSVLR